MKELQWRDILTRIILVIATVGIVVWAMPHDSSAIQLYEPYYILNKEVENQMVERFNRDFKDGLSELPDNYKIIITNRLHSLYQQGILEQKDYTDLRKDTTNMLRIVTGKQAINVSIMELYSPKTAYEQLFKDGILALQRPLLQKCNLNTYITSNLTYDRERSESSKNDLLSGIAQASGVVQKGEKIVGRGEIVTEKTYRILESFKKENERLNEDVRHNHLMLVGQIIYMTILMVCFTIFLSLYRRDYFDKPRSITMLYALIVVFALLTALLMRNTLVHVYILPYAMVPIFIRVFMDSRTAFMTHMTMVLVCSVMLQHPFEFVVLETVAGLVAISSLRELSQRSQLFKTAILITLTSIGINIAFNWMSNDTLAQIDLSTINYLIVNGIALLFAYPMLYLMEKAFGFTSDITLIELSNTNNELLRRMSEVAPGTFNHSIQVANLAGEIANKIGAKSQLVRTGALYHDIGKLANPIYFTENQSGIDPHETLNDIESAQIIISHVTEGLKMADKYNLPAVIRDFIATHHGQGKAKFFYIRYHNEHPDEPVDDLLFTYPGPNPFTREQACLMMADTIEAASRSLPDYTEQSIRGLVERLIDGQVADGYFRECPITFRDIQYAKTVLIEKLKTIYHTRVSYPSEK